MLNSPETKTNNVWTVTVEPLMDPVSVDELKSYARIDGSNEDNLIATLIESATGHIEDFLGRSLINRTMTLSFDVWDKKVISLPKPPLVSISSVVTLDEDGTETTYAATNYYVVTESIPGELVIKQSSSLPTNTVRDRGGFKITYIAGYGATANLVPRQIRQAILQLVTLRYEKRIADEEIPPEVVKGIQHMRVYHRYYE